MAVIAGVNAPEVGLLGWHQSEKLSVSLTDVKQGGREGGAEVEHPPPPPLLPAAGMEQLLQRRIMWCFWLWRRQRNCRSSWWNRLSWGRSWSENFSIWKVRPAFTCSFIHAAFTLENVSVKERISTHNFLGWNGNIYIIYIIYIYNIICIIQSV